MVCTSKLEWRVKTPFLSAMSMIGADENQPHSYLELVDAIRQHGADVRKDLKELWRRILFSVLVSNVDDHLRNHGFLYDTRKHGWRLSPAYDLNPVPVDIFAAFSPYRVALFAHLCDAAHLKFAETLGREFPRLAVNQSPDELAFDSTLLLLVGFCHSVSPLLLPTFQPRLQHVSVIG